MKMPALESLLIKLQACRSAILFNSDSNTGFFPVNIMKFLRAPILKNICKRLLLENAQE